MRVTINGYIVSDEDVWIYEYFGYSAVSPSTIRDALASCPADEALVLEINSPGGSVFAGDEMYSLLRSSGRQITAEVQSMAASAASVVMLGCQRVLVSPVAQIMIHLPSMSTDGDEGAHRQSLQLLQSTLDAILNAYELKCGARCTRAELEEMTRATTWLDARRAVEIGLADGVLYADGEAPLSDQLVACVGSSLRGLCAAGGQMPSAQELRARYAASGQTPPEGDPTPAPGPTPPESTLSDDWRVRARLDVAKQRYR